MTVVIAVILNRSGRRAREKGHPMNVERRKQLNLAIGLLEQMEALRDVALEIISTARDEEQEAFDNMPEGLQGAERGQNMETAISEMETAISALEEIYFDDLKANVEEAKGE